MPGPGYWSSKNYFGAAPTFAAGATFGGNLDMGNNLVINIGAAGTDFTSGGGLALAGALTVTSTTNTVDIGTATALFRTAYFGTSVQSGVSAALDADVTGVAIIGTPAVFGLGSSTKAPLVAMANGATTAAAALPFIKTRSTGTDANTAIVSGDELALIPAYGADGAALVRSGSIRYVSVGTIASTRVGGKWELYTGTDATPTVETLALTVGTDQIITGQSRIDSGAGNAGSGYLGGSSGLIGWLSRSQLKGTIDGQLTLSNNAETDFTRLNFGGTTSAFGALSRDGAGIQLIAGDGTTGIFLSGVEQTAPAAPAANGYRIFAQDNGSGKTQLFVIFASGAAQQIAIQP